MTQEEHLEYSHHSSSNSVHDQVNDDTTKSKNITTAATSNQAMIADPTTTSCSDAQQTDKLSQSDSNRRLNDKQQLIDNIKYKNVSDNNSNNIKDKPNSECVNKTVNKQLSDINENNNNNKQIENKTKTFNSDIVTDSNKDCSKISEENNRRKYFNRSRQSTFDRSVSLDIEDPIERLNKLKSNITDVLKEVKAVLDKHSEPEQEKDEDIKPLDEKVVRFRFIRRVRKKTSFDLEDEQARRNILREEEELKNTEDQNKMGIQNSFVISSEDHTNVIDNKKLDIEGHKSDISEFNEDKLDNNTSWIQDSEYYESRNSNQSSNTNVDTNQKSVTEEKVDELKVNQTEDLNKQIEPQLISAQTAKIHTLIKQQAIDESIPAASTLKTDSDKLVKTEEPAVIVNKTDSIETSSTTNDKSVEEKPKKKIVKKTISSSSKEKLDTNKLKEPENKLKTKLANKTNSAATKAEKSEQEIVKTINKTCESQENNKSEVKEVSQNSQDITPSTTGSISAKTSIKTSVSEPSKIVDENKSEINKVSVPVKINKSSSVEQRDKSNKTESIKTTGENLKEVGKEVDKKEVEKELQKKELDKKEVKKELDKKEVEKEFDKKELAKEVTKSIVKQKTTTKMPPQSTDDSLTNKKETPAEDVVKKKIVKKVIKPATDSGNDVKATVKTTKEARKGSITSSDVQKSTSASSSESPSVKEEPTEDKIKKKVVKKVTKSTSKDQPVEGSAPSDSNKKVEVSVSNVEDSSNQLKSSTIETPVNEEISTDKTKKKIIKKSVNDNDNKKVTKTVKSEQIKPTEHNKIGDSSVKSSDLNAEIISNATTLLPATTAATTAASSADKNLSSSNKNSNLIETNHTKAEDQRSSTTKDNNEPAVPAKTTSHIPIPAKSVVPASPKDVVPASKNEIESVSAKDVVPIPSKDLTVESAKKVPDVPENKISTPSISQKPDLNETKDENQVKVPKESATAPKLTVTAPKKELKDEKNLKLPNELKPEEKKLIRRRPSAPEQLEGTKEIEKVILRRRPSSLLPNSLSTVQKSLATSEEKTLVRRRPSSLVLNSTTEQKDDTIKQTRRRPSSLLASSTILEQDAIKVEPIAAKPASESKSKEEYIDNKSHNSLPVPSSESSSSSFPQGETKSSPVSSPISPTSKSFGISALDKVLATTNFKPITDKKVVSQIIVKPPMSMMLQSQKSIDKLGFESSNTTTKPTVSQENQTAKTSTTSTPVGEPIISMKQISEKDLTDNHTKIPSNNTDNALTTSIPKEVDTKSISNDKTVPIAETVATSSTIQKTIEQKIPTVEQISSDNKTLKNKKVEQPPTKPDEISCVQQPPVKNEIKIKQDDKTQEDVVITSKKSSPSLDKLLIGKTQQTDDKNNNKQTNQHAAHIPSEKEADTKKESATKAEKIKTNDVSSNDQQKSSMESTSNKAPAKVASEKTPKLTPKTPLKVEKNSVMTVAVKPQLTLLPAPSKAVQLVSTKLDVIPVKKASVVKTVVIKKPTPQTPVVEYKHQEASAVETAKAGAEQVAEQPSVSVGAVQPTIKVDLEKEEVAQSSTTPSTEVATTSIKTVEAEPSSVALPETLGSTPASTEPSATPSEISDPSLEPPAAPSETTDATVDEPKTDDAALPPKKPKKKKSKSKKIIKVVIKRIKRKLSKDDTPIVEVEPEICEKEIEPEPEPDSEEEPEPEPAGPTKPKSCLKLREYEPGDIVMYADRIRKMVKWKKATVLERITSISYKLDVNGEEKSAHVCYIKKYTDKKVQFGGKEYLEIDYAQLEAEEEEPEYNIWARV